MRLFTPIPLWALLTLVTCVACGGRREGGSDPGRDARFVELALEKRATDEIVGYYMDAFMALEGDPFEARLVVKEAGKYFVDLERFRQLDSVSATTLTRIADEDRIVDWDAFSSFISDEYFRARRIPSTRSELDGEEGFDGGGAWMQLEVLGVMSTQRRRVLVRRDDVLQALRTYRSNEDRIIYPAGTVFIGEHLEDDSVSETTVMRKSTSGYWDFFAYGGGGDRIDSTLAMPRSRHVPTQCVGCHFGDKLYEPERSFPAQAEDGPHGPRAVFVDEALRDPEVVRYFDEHRKRSDRILGLYGTVLISQLRADRAAGELDDESARLLESLGL